MVTMIMVMGVNRHAEFSAHHRHYGGAVGRVRRRIGQQKPRDRVGEFEERINALERRASREPFRVESEAHAVAEIAKMTLESYDRNFGVIKWVATGIATALSVMIALFAWFGFSEYRQIIAPMKRSLEDLKKDYEELVRQTREEGATLSKLRDDLLGQKNGFDKYRDGMVRDVSGLIHTVSAFTYLQTNTPDFHRLGLHEIEKAMRSEPTHPKVLGWAYAIRGYLLRRQVPGPAGLQQALEQVQRATEVDPGNERAVFNAACYACLLGRKEEWVRYLTRAVELNPGFKTEAIRDPDFASVAGDTDFRQITGQG